MPQPMPETMHTMTSLQDDLRRVGWHEGMHVIVHASFKQVGGYVCGGAEAMISAMRHVIGDTGTLMMPSHSADNTEPAHWENPPVPESWWQTIRDNMPAYDPRFSATRMMGVLADTLRIMPTAKRSAHPSGSFSAIGAERDSIVAHHDLENAFGENSPLSRLYDLGGYVCLLGVGHGNNTSLHLAEHRAEYPSKRYNQQGSAMLVDGKRQWVTFRELAYDDDDFVQLGTDFEAAHPEAVTVGRIGNAEVRTMQMRALVDFGVQWMEANRHLRSDGGE
jgi:aminoglycoside 3-N-acetyltransferase